MSETNNSDEESFELGQNWKNLMKKIWRNAVMWLKNILDFIGRDNLDGLDFFDVGCGSGLHSLGAYQTGASKIHNFDFDENSVTATKMLHKYTKLPEKPVRNICLSAVEHPKYRLSLSI